MKRVIFSAIKRVNGWSRGRQLMLLLVLCMVAAGLLCTTGCGGCEIETPKCASTDDVTMLSVPGCGGCLTPEKGCGSALWAKSCILVKGSWEDASPEGNVLACDIRYLGGECGGCLQTEQSCYFGRLVLTDGNDSESGFFRGSSEKGTEEIRDSSGCVTTPYFNGMGRQFLDLVEAETEVD